MRKKDKDKINILLNINNYFGKHSGRVGPTLTYLAVVLVPFLLYVMFLSFFIPFKVFIVIEAIFAFRMALIILGREKDKLAIYMKNLNNEYASADDLVRVVNFKEDGLVEYSNGEVAYVISALPMSYFSDNAFSKDLELFKSKLDKYAYDIHLHNVVGELTAVPDLEKLSVYKDKAMLRERLEFYKEQDRISDSKTTLYRFNYVVRAPKYKWAELKQDLVALINSSYANCFKVIYLCNRDEADKVMSRDICAYLDLEKMITNKYNSTETYGSKILYFDDDNIIEDEDIDSSLLSVETERRVIKND